MFTLYSFYFIFYFILLYSSQTGKHEPVPVHFCSDMTGKLNKYPGKFTQWQLVFKCSVLPFMKTKEEYFPIPTCFFSRSKSRQHATVEQQQAFSLLFFAFLTRILALMIYNQREELPRLFEWTIQFFTNFYCTLIKLN